MYILTYSEGNETTNEAVSESIEALKVEAATRNGEPLDWEDLGNDEYKALLDEDVDEDDEMYYHICKIDKV